jgi:hypothetical protein
VEPEKEKPTYEERSELIDNEIRKRRPKWRLTSLAWVDFDDVSQIMRAHIAKKWDQWDPARPLVPWVNKIITNQFKNILRNHYHNFVKPCMGCPFNNSMSEEENSCTFTKSKTQNSTCPLYKKWSKSKKHAYGIKIPVPIEILPRAEVESKEDGYCEIDFYIGKIHAEVEKQLTERNFSIYTMLFIEEITEEDIAKKLGYKTSEKGRKAGYKQIKNLKLKFKKLVIKILEKKDIFYT